MANLFHQSFNLGAIAVLQAGLLAMVVPTDPAQAFNQFDVCVSELLDREIAQTTALRACAEALKPKDLSLCVLRIGSQTAVTADEALAACFQVRRPLELADCAININNSALEPYISKPEADTSVQQPTALVALTNCRRSLLPKRYAECVIAASRNTNLSPATAMDTCISAEDYPSVLFPSNLGS